MNLRTAAFIAVSAIALSLAACQGLNRPERAITRLDCPERSGVLKRVSVAADGKSCVYKAADGADVTLKLVPVTGGVKATLAALEREALALRGPEPDPAALAQAAAPAEGAAKDAAATIAQAEADTKALGTDDPDVVAIVDATDADLDVPGLHIIADDDGANIKIGGVEIDAGDHGATVRDVKDVRLRGEATAREKRGVRALFIQSGGESDTRPSVAYQAAGPKGGPITVAITKWASGSHDDFYNDVRKLVRRNGGA